MTSNSVTTSVMRSSHSLNSLIPSTSSLTKDNNHIATNYQEESESETETESETNSKELEGSNEEEEEEEEDDEDVSWVAWFCQQKGNEFFCQVDDSFILDDSNLIGLSSQVPCYDYALDLILDVDSSHDEFTDEQNDLVEWAAEMLYGLVHARYILTSQGMSAMVEKYRSCDFGTCPRFHCSKQRCLPIGESDTPRSRTVKIYCPKCEDMYAPESKHQEPIPDIDGAYFGTTFPHMFFMNYENLKPPKVSQSYVPRIYGFKISK